MGNRTPLYEEHLRANAKMVDFGGWDMPINYGSQIEEHNQVRQDAGMFDVSHMTIVDLSGDKVKPFLQYLLANNVDRLKDKGKALYTCMLNEQGGVIDDLIVYYLGETFYRMVVNAATREKDLAWIEKHAAAYDVTVNVRDDMAMIAVQGPNARDKAHKVLGVAIADQLVDIKPFFMREMGDVIVARTGYTGEDGYEIMLPANQAPGTWRQLVEAGVKPTGLGARDTLRLEAGMNLYGHDMDENTTPLESGLSWTVAWEPEDRDFIGRAALARQKSEGVKRKLVGLVLEDRGVLRDHQKVIVDGEEAGEITSGSFSPTLGKSIAFARVPASVGTHCQVDVRGKLLNARVVKLSFVRNGKPCIDV
ncbi:glycine cleavage system aminomethyltransferase GcvT [Thiohalophilus thiocyanatoxydans]|uniref:Aminomethyltransferase n=1 Tax=Thiohalophilus thiocyanatoxydans TaxID=381308 RepID=A0A4R8ITG9_9GAMM|nr:glycine cleavage system aminomethyltransferase GcvT [Thiohalophilus thiocyanatoxydans]TDY04296.1 aminomethyltransferase [Thiohalophilus thiocyanatoxydans]